MSPITLSPICSSVDRCLWASVSLNQCLCLCVCLSLSCSRLCVSQSVCHFFLSLSRLNAPAALVFCFTRSPPWFRVSHVFRHMSRWQSLKGLFEKNVFTCISFPYFLFLSLLPLVWSVCVFFPRLCCFLMSFLFFWMSAVLCLHVRCVILNQPKHVRADTSSLHICNLCLKI